MAGTMNKHLYAGLYRMPALGWWLMAVGIFRFGISLSCWFSPICSATFSETQGSGVHLRAVAVFTLLSCTLCFLCAFNLQSKPIYAATFLSFIYALSFLSAECVVFHTITAAALAPFVVVAGTSIVWMLLQWNSPGHGPRLRGATSKET